MAPFPGSNYMQAFSLNKGGRTGSVFLCLLLASGHLWTSPYEAPGHSPIHFVARPIPFTLDSSESPRRHVPETMAGGVAVFDYNNDGYPDIFFANGADINTLKKACP